VQGTNNTIIAHLHSRRGNSSTEPYIVAHNILLSHAVAYWCYQLHFKVLLHIKMVALSISFLYIKKKTADRKYSLPGKARRSNPNSIGFQVVRNRYLMLMRTKMRHKEQWILELDGSFVVFIIFGKESVGSYGPHITNQKRIRFLDPLFSGKYPHSMKKLEGERLPLTSLEMSKLLVGSSEFVGINHYTILYIRNDRTWIQKLILLDASSYAAVNAACKIMKYCSVCLRRVHNQAMT